MIFRLPMIFRLLESPNYAETHYKFKLPWSRLHKSWPEIFLDAPCRVEPLQPVPLVLVLRDANLYPVRIKSIHLEINALSWPTLREKVVVEQDFDQAFHFVELPFSLEGRKGQVSVNATIEVHKLGKPQSLKRIKNWNFPTINPRPLGIHALEFPNPKPSQWWSGETHCHTWHSSDPVEFGAPPWLLQKAAQSLGLDFVLCTDHSYDFDFQQANYRLAADSEQRWQELQQEVQSLPPYPLVIAGEEVSCGNSRGENVHLLVCGHKNHIPGAGDSGRRWLKNHPTHSINEVLEMASPVPCFAAHPQQPMSALERFVFRRGYYQNEDLGLNGSNPIAGLEFWNGMQDEGYKIGRLFWIEQLLQGQRILPIGGNDAHGDLNHYTGVKTPLWSLKANRARLFGRTRTVFYAANPLLSPATLQQSIAQAQQSGYAYVSDGPALWWDQNSDSAKLCGLSTPDFGTIEMIQVFRGYGNQKVEEQEIYTVGINKWEKNMDFDGADYMRAELHTRLGYKAMTAALWA